MDKRLSKVLNFWLLFFMAILACNLPSNVNAPPSARPGVTVIVLPTKTRTVGPAIAKSPIATGTITLTPTATITSSPTVTPTPQNPLILEDVLCYGGPGKAYEVISTLRAGTRVKLLGRGMQEGWWVVLNPTYHDPCWLPVGVLQIDPGFNTTTLPNYKIPPTPTP